MAAEERQGRGMRGHAKLAGLCLLGTTLLVAALAIAGVILASGRPVPAPHWVVERAEAEIATVLEGQLTPALGGVDFFLEKGWQPRIRFRDLHLEGPGGREVMAVPDLRLVLDRDSLLMGRLRPARLQVPGLALNLLRRPDGQLDVILGTDRAALRALGSLPEVLGALDELLDAPVLDRLQAVDITGLNLTLADQSTGRDWALTDGTLHLARDAEATRVDLGFAMGAAEDAAAPDGKAAMSLAAISFTTEAASLAARLEIELAGVEASHIAVQAPALAWLGVLDARVSGQISARTGADGALLPVEGRLSIAPGRLLPRQGLRPIPFDGATLAFRMDPDRGRFDFSQIEVKSPALRFAASGQAFLGDMRAGLPQSVVAQVALSRLEADPEGVFEAPVAFSGGQADLKFALDPFALTIGQAVLWEGEERLALSGRIGAAEKGWEAALDVAVNRIGHDRLLGLWPEPLVARTRNWLKENVNAGELFNVRGAVRLAPEQEPRLSLGYEFFDADVRALPTLPPIRGGRGRAAMEDTRYVMAVDAGHVVAPEGGAVDVAGSVFSVPDIRAKPATAVVDLKARGPVRAGLSLLDQPPFLLLSKAGQSPDIAEGEAEVTAHVEAPMVKRPSPESIDFHVAATLLGVSSDRIVPGRRLEAERLQLSADPDLLRIEGPGRLSGVPFTAVWRQPLDRTRAGPWEEPAEGGPPAESATEPGVGPVAEPGAEARAEQVVEPGAEPRAGPATEPGAEADAEPAARPEPEAAPQEPPRAVGAPRKRPARIAAAAGEPSAARPGDPGQDRTGRSELVATIPLSPRAAEVFAPGLPESLLSGAGTGELAVDLVKGRAPRFSLTSDLTGLGLALPELGWAKPRASAGRLRASGTLGQPPVIESLSLSAPGLTLEEGRVDISGAGGLERARFGRVRLGGWLDAAVTLTGRGAGVPPAVEVAGGTLDLRRLPGSGGDASPGASGRVSGGTSGTGAAVPLQAALERVIVSDSLALTDVSGRFSAGGGGVTGPFRGRLNGGPELAGTVSPHLIRLQSRDAGAVLAAAGITPRAGGGALDLTLTPRGGAGDYDGLLRITDLRLRDAPTLAGLLSAISVVGLVEQLSGDGILFSEVDVEFRLTPGAVEIKRASATGPSLGVTAAGVYLMAENRMELTGTVSPIYLLNRLGEVMTGKGEGVFGFTYALSGSASAPSISVNPLSVLAPGPLRRLFQRPTPQLAP